MDFFFGFFAIWCTFDTTLGPLSVSCNHLHHCVLCTLLPCYSTSFSLSLPFSRFSNAHTLLSYENRAGMKFVSILIQIIACTTLHYVSNRMNKSFRNIYNRICVSYRKKALSTEPNCPNLNANFQHNNMQRNKKKTGCYTFNVL